MLASTMSDDQLDDLKQFIAVTLGQTEVRIGERIDGVEQKLEALTQNVDDGFAGVGEAIEEINNRIDNRPAKLKPQTT